MVVRMGFPYHEGGMIRVLVRRACSRALLLHNNFLFVSLCIRAIRTGVPHRGRGRRAGVQLARYDSLVPARNLTLLPLHDVVSPFQV
jgi:hypothetical protein